MPRKQTPRTIVMNTADAAVYVGLSESTLEKKRHTDGGPKFADLDGAVRYRISDLDEWVAGKVVRSSRDRKPKPPPG